MIHLLRIIKLFYGSLFYNQNVMSTLRLISSSAVFYVIFLDIQNALI